jgi:D-arginine dehydrogenase
LQGFLRQFRQSGGCLRTGEGVRALRRDGQHWQVQTGTAGYRAAVLVNAAGAWADQIGRLAGAQTIGLVPKRRSACIIEPGNRDVAGSPMVGDVDQEFYFKPEAGKLLLSPADETPMQACDVYPEDLDIARAVAHLERATTIRVTRKIERQWAGLRSFVEDNSPVVGYDADVPGFFWLAGQGGFGIQTAPAMGRMAAALATGAPVPEDLAGEGVTEEALSPRRLRELPIGRLR